MKTLHLASISLSIVCALALTAAPRAMSEAGPVANANVLLDEAKKIQAQRKKAIIQTVLNRLAEDSKKGQQELNEVEQNISKVGNAVTQAKSHIEELAGRKKKVLQDLELLGLRTEAEKLKADGLALLNTANEKAKEALTRHNEETELKTAIAQAQMQKLTESENADPEAKKTKGESPTLTELRRNLAKAENKSELADIRAHEAMNTATAKLAQADAAAAKVDKRQAEFDAENTNAPKVEESATFRAKKTR